MRFLLGVVVGFIAARMVRPEAVSMKKFEEGFADMQKRAEAVLIESRRIREETRKELSAAMEASRSSVQEKAERLRTAVTEPETVIGHEGEMLPQPGQEPQRMQRPSVEGEKGPRVIRETERTPRPSEVE